MKKVVNRKITFFYIFLIILILPSNIQLTVTGSNIISKSTKDRKNTNVINHSQSNNSLLWLDDLKEYEILNKKPHKLSNSEHISHSSVVDYDIKTKNVFSTSREKIKDRNQTEIIEYNQGIIQQEYLPESIILPDDRVKVLDPTIYPWSTICKLFITAGNGAIYVGSGFIVGSPDGHGYHVLTAGHCVYNPESGGWATSIEIIPALNENYLPFWHAYAISIRTYTGWTDYQMPEYDMALITLDRNIGDYTGWMGIKTEGYTDPIYTGTLHTAGYPADLDDGYCMYWDSDTGISATEYNHWYNMDTYGGQSGSPVWYEDSGPYVLTIHAYGGGGFEPNFGTRINSEKFDDITNWCNEDTPPQNYANLIDDGQSYSGFSPDTLDHTGTNVTIWSSERNIGTVDSEDYYVKYYASIDTEITIDDYFIGTVYVDNVSPFTFHDSEWSGVFPDISAGEYWIGWIIDSNNDVTELIDDGESDNTVYKTSYKLSVEYSLDNYNPIIEMTSAWVDGIGTLDQGAAVSQGEKLFLRTVVSDRETPSSGLSVDIGLRLQGGTWIFKEATYETSQDYWYIYWNIPIDAELGLYDVRVDASDPHDGTNFQIVEGLFSVENLFIATELTLDDDDAVYTGTWPSSFVTSGYYGSGYRYRWAGTGLNTATWTFNVPYEDHWWVFIRWTSSSNRATNAKYTIYNSGEETLLQLNQQKDGGEWVFLGRPWFYEGSIDIVLSDNADGVVIADAIKLISTSDSPPQPPPPPSTDIILDDDDAVYTGTWPSSSVTSGYYGSGYRYRWAGTGSNTASWNVAIPEAGSWEVFARWTSSSNRAPNAPYTIFYENGLSTIKVNQQNAGGDWNSLGVYSFNEGTVSIVLSDDADGVVIADAIKLISTKEPPPPPSPLSTDIIIDDDEAVFEGAWPSSAATSGFYGTGYRYHPSGTGSNTATWHVNIPEADAWEVFARWTSSSNRASNAPYTINSEYGGITVRVNQEVNSGEWVSLGIYPFTHGDASVILSDDANEYVIADAIRFTKIDSPPPPPPTPPLEIIIDDIDASFVGSWPSSSMASGYYGSGYRYRWAGTGLNAATWAINIPELGVWEVYAQWTSGSNRATNAPYTINWHDGSTTQTVNQQENGGEWISLGIYDFSEGSYNIVVSDNADGVVIADAIKLVKIIHENS